MKSKSKGTFFFIILVSMHIVWRVNTLEYVNYSVMYFEPGKNYNNAARIAISKNCKIEFKDYKLGAGNLTAQ